MYVKCGLLFDSWLETCLSYPDSTDHLFCATPVFVVISRLIFRCFGSPRQLKIDRSLAHCKTSSYRTVSYLYVSAQEASRALSLSDSSCDAFASAVRRQQCCWWCECVEYIRVTDVWWPARFVPSAAHFITARRNTHNCTTLRRHAALLTGHQLTGWLARDESHSMSHRTIYYTDFAWTTKLLLLLHPFNGIFLGQHG